MRAPVRESLLWSWVSLCVVVAVVVGATLDNRDLVSLADIARPLAVLGLAAVALNLVLMALVPTIGRVFPAALLAAFAYGRVRHGLADTGYGTFLAWGWMVSVPLAVHLVLRRFDRSRVLHALATGASFAALATCMAVAPSLWYADPPTIDEDFERAVRNAAGRSRAAAELPDILYVVPDRYPSAGTLRREFGIDNAAFYEALRARGFMVAEDALANYPKTFQSLASTLNSGYLDSFARAYGPDTGDRRPVFDAIEDNVVQEHLRGLGYEFHNYGNWWEPTRLNRWADVNDRGHPGRVLDGLSELERLLLRTTPASDLLRRFGDGHHNPECRRIQRKFRRLREVGNGPVPVFVFAHMLVPHPPIVMDASGDCLDRPMNYRPGHTNWRDFSNAWIDYLRYFNAAVLRVVDTQLERRRGNGRPLLFVVQSDEGAFPRLVREGHAFNAMTLRDLRMKMGILNAVRLPEEMNAGPHDPSSIATPVNNWRIVLGALSGSGMEMLPHRSYIYPSADSVYRFCDVTAILSVSDDGGGSGGNPAAPDARPPVQGDGAEADQGVFAHGEPLSSRLPDCGPDPNSQRD